MLVLSRYSNESIILANGDIKITVLDIQHGRVSIGIQAPHSIDVHREEVFYKIQQEKAKGKSNLLKLGQGAAKQKIKRSLADRLYIDPELLNQAGNDDVNAQFELGKIFFQQERYGFSKEFLTMAVNNGCVAAADYLSTISKVEPTIFSA